MNPEYGPLLAATTNHGNGANLALGAAFFILLVIAGGGLRKYLQNRPSGRRPSASVTRLKGTRLKSALKSSSKSPGKDVAGLAGGLLRAGWKLGRSLADPRTRRTAEAARAKKGMEESRKTLTNAQNVAKYGYASPGGVGGFRGRIKEAWTGIGDYFHARDMWINRRGPEDAPDKAFKGDAPGPGRSDYRSHDHADRSPTQSMPEPPLRPEPTPSSGHPGPTSTPGGSMPANVPMFMAAERAANQSFGSLVGIERFLQITHQGEQQLPELYLTTAGRLDDELNIHAFATQHLEDAAKAQIGLAGHVSDVAKALSELLNMSPQEAAERGIRMPRRELLDGEINDPMTPELFEQIGQLARVDWEGNPVQGHMFVKALYDAGDQKLTMWTRLQARLAEDDMPLMVLTPMGAVIASQNTVNNCVALGDNNYGHLLRLSHRELAHGPMRTPTGNK
jgi:hypothetical protein